MAQWAGRTTLLWDIHVKIQKILSHDDSCYTISLKKSRTSPPPSSSGWQGRALCSPVTVCELHSLSSCCFHTLDSWWGNSTLQLVHLRQWMLRLPQSCSMALSPHHMISTTDQPFFPSPVISTLLYLNLPQVHSLIWQATVLSVYPVTIHPLTRNATSGKSLFLLDSFLDFEL